MADQVAPAAPQDPSDPNEAGEAGGEDGQSQVTQLVTNTAQGLGMLAEMVSQAMPDVGGELKQISDQFKALMNKAMGGDGAPSPAQAAPPESGGKPGAVPASPAMR